MATLKQIRDSIAAKSKDSNFTAVNESLVDYEINRAIRYYETTRFWFNEAQSDITLNVGDNVVPNIPSDSIAPFLVNGVTLVDNQIKEPMEKKLPDFYDSMDAEQTGRPSIWTYKNGQFLVLPYPASAYILQFRYLKSYTGLVNDNDTNDFTKYAQDLISMRALSTIYTEYKEAPDLAQFYEGRAASELVSLTKRTNMLNASGRLEVNTILND